MGTGVPYFPQTLPANTVVGRLASGAGPTEAIPLAALAALISDSVLLATGIALSSASLDFTGLTGFTHYLFELDAVIPASAGVLWMRISEDNGATWKAGSTDYSYAGTGIRSGGTNNSPVSTGAAQIAMGNANSAQQGVSGRVWVPDLTVSNINPLTWLIGTGENGFNTEYVGTGLYITDTNTINGIRFLMSSGPIASGAIRCRGLKN